MHLGDNLLYVPMNISKVRKFLTSTIGEIGNPISNVAQVICLIEQNELTPSCYNFRWYKIPSIV